MFASIDRYVFIAKQTTTHTYVRQNSNNKDKKKTPNKAKKCKQILKIQIKTSKIRSYVFSGFCYCVYF